MHSVQHVGGGHTSSGGMATWSSGRMGTSRYRMPFLCSVSTMSMSASFSLSPGGMAALVQRASSFSARLRYSTSPACREGVTCNDRSARKVCLIPFRPCCAVSCGKLGWQTSSAQLQASRQGCPPAMLPCSCDTTALSKESRAAQEACDKSPWQTNIQHSSLLLPPHAQGEFRAAQGYAQWLRQRCRLLFPCWPNGWFP